MKKSIALIALLLNCVVVFSQVSQPKSKFTVGVEYSNGESPFWVAQSLSYYGVTCDLALTKQFSIYTKPKFHYSYVGDPGLRFFDSPRTGIQLFFSQLTSFYVPVAVKYSPVFNKKLSPYIGGGFNNHFYFIKPDGGRTISGHDAHGILDVGINIRIKNRIYVDISAFSSLLRKSSLQENVFLGSIGLNYKI